MHFACPVFKRVVPFFRNYNNFAAEFLIVQTIRHAHGMVTHGTIANDTARNMRRAHCFYSTKLIRKNSKIIPK